MKKIGLIGSLLISVINVCFSQGGVGINLNGTLPNNSAMLDVESNDKGVLIPRVTLTGTSDNTTISGGNVEALLVYNTSTVADVTPGFYYWNGTSWQRLVAGSIVGTDDQNLTGASIAGTNLQIDIESGNSTSIDLISLLNPSNNFTDSIANLLVQDQNFLSVIADSVDSDVDSVRLVGNNLTIYEKGNGVFQDLSMYLDADDWGSQTVVAGIGFSGNGTLTNPLNYTEVDGSTSNELNTNLGLIGTTLNLVDAGGTLSQSLEPVLDTAKHREEWVDGSFVGLTPGDVFARRALLSNDTVVIQSNGEVGIGVANPASSLDVQGVFNRHIRVGKENEAGNISFIRGDGTVSTYIGMASSTSISDFQILNQSGGGEVNIVTNAGSTAGGHFSVSSYAGTNPGTHFIVRNNGHVGIGTVTPAEALEVCGNAIIVGNIDANSANLSAGVTCSSDKRLKEKINEIDHALKIINRLEGRSYYWNVQKYPNRGFTQEKQYGYIAQDLETVLPDLVKTGEDGYKSVNYIAVIPILTEAIKELSKKVEAVEQENQTLLEKLNK